MKTILGISLIAVLLISFSIEKGDEPLEVSFNGKTHKINVGDTVHIGYGSADNKSFVFIKGAENSLPATWSKSTGIVYKIKYYKNIKQNWVYIKDVPGRWVIVVPQAIEQGEVIGFNSTMFN